MGNVYNSCAVGFDHCFENDSCFFSNSSILEGGLCLPLYLQHCTLPFFFKDSLLYWVYMCVEEGRSVGRIAHLIFGSRLQVSSQCLFPSYSNGQRKATCQPISMRFGQVISCPNFYSMKCEKKYVSLFSCALKGWHVHLPLCSFTHTDAHLKSAAMTRVGTLDMDACCWQWLNLNCPLSFLP